MVKSNIGLVYGGGNIGLMGEIAHTVDDGGVEVIGVIPEALVDREVSGTTVGETIVVDSMHTRKATMASKADGFVALPGGYGTLEELLEIITWQQLGYHARPVGVLNVEGYYDPLLHMFDEMVRAGFLRQQSRDIVLVSSDPAELLQKLRDYTAPPSVIELAKQGKLDPMTRG